MELYLFFAFLLFYLITAFMLNQKSKEKIWIIAFIISFAVTSVAIAFIKAGRQDVMMNADQINWYYILYLFGMISVVLGVFNLWIYRKPLWNILIARSDESEDDDEEDD